MKIVLTGGGSGGHFYPLIAVAEELRELVREQKLIEPELFYLAPEPYDNEALFENTIEFRRVPAGKMRLYFSLKNLIDIFKTATGIVVALLQLFSIFPDVVFSKGGFVSVPVLFAARFFRIPVIIHESDSVAGRANTWAGKFAKRIAIAYEEAGKNFPKEKVALVGNPVRKALRIPAESGAREFLKLEENIPTILVLGGSQGAEVVNDTLIETLPQLLEHYQIIHQTGEQNLTAIEQAVGVLLENNPHRSRYKPFSFLNTLALRMSAGVADLVITRAGSGALFEVALWGKPAIVIPIPTEVSRDQRANAAAYTKSGAGIIIQQANLTPSILVSEITRLMDNAQDREAMSQAARAFAKPDAARKIAREVLDLALAHEA